MKKLNLFFFFLFFQGVCLFCQQHRSIVLTSPKGVDTWIISEGDKMKYELKADFHGMYRGRVKQVKDSSLMINGKEIFFSKLKTVKLSKAPARKAIMLGLVMAGLGVASRPANESLGNPIPGQMLVIQQIAFIGTGSFFVIRGIVELFANHKFKLYDGWTIRSVPLATLEE
jgi:hypothetical protein